MVRPPLAGASESTKLFCNIRVWVVNVYILLRKKSKRSLFCKKAPARGALCKKLLTVFRHTHQPVMAAEAAIHAVLRYSVARAIRDGKGVDARFRGHDGT
jgi:hypothetical protein